MEAPSKYGHSEAQPHYCGISIKLFKRPERRKWEKGLEVAEKKNVHQNRLIRRFCLLDRFKFSSDIKMDFSDAAEFNGQSPAKKNRFWPHEWGNSDMFLQKSIKIGGWNSDIPEFSRMNSSLVSLDKIHYVPRRSGERLSGEICKPQYASYAAGWSGPVLLIISYRD